MACSKPADGFASASQSLDAVGARPADVDGVRFGGPAELDLFPGPLSQPGAAVVN